MNPTAPPKTWTTVYWPWGTELRTTRTSGLLRTRGAKSGEMKDIFSWPGTLITCVALPLRPPTLWCKATSRGCGLPGLLPSGVKPSTGGVCAHLNNSIFTYRDVMMSCYIKVHFPFSSNTYSTYLLSYITKNQAMMQFTLYFLVLEKWAYSHYVRDVIEKYMQLYCIYIFLY